jgi:hypothetical protein
MSRRTRVIARLNGPTTGLCATSPASSRCCDRASNKWGLFGDRGVVQFLSWSSRLLRKRAADRGDGWSPSPQPRLTSLPEEPPRGLEWPPLAPHAAPLSSKVSQGVGLGQRSPFVPVRAHAGPHEGRAGLRWSAVSCEPMRGWTCEPREKRERQAPCCSFGLKWPPGAW